MNPSDNSESMTVREILFQLSNDSMWCLPDVVGAVRVDREKQERHIKEAARHIEQLIVEAKISELERIAKLPGHYGARDYDMECHNRIAKLKATLTTKQDKE